MARAYHLSEETNALVTLDDKAKGSNDEARLALYMFQAIAYLKLHKVDEAKLKFIATKQIDGNSVFSQSAEAHHQLF